jgi:hypothetical protein
MPPASSSSVSVSESSVSVAAESSSSSSSAVDVCADGERRIELVPTFQKQYVSNNTDGFRLRVDARNNCQMDAEIFRHYQYPPDVNTGDTVSHFTGVCSWPDLEDLPVTTPRDDDCPKAFRLDYFDIVVATESLAYEVWELIQQEVTQLVETMNEGDILEAGDSFWAGGAPSE